MKYNIDGVLVVEGKEDVGFLSSFINALFFITNGYDLKPEKIDFLSRVSKVNKLIILTDSDDAGEQIRNKLKSQINGVFDVKIPKISRKNAKKHGVAETPKEVVVEALKPYFVDEPIKYNSLDLISYISLGNNPGEKRQEVINKYRLIPGNNKSLENQLKMLKISKEELWK